MIDDFVDVDESSLEINTPEGEDFSADVQEPSTEDVPPSVEEVQPPAEDVPPPVEEVPPDSDEVPLPPVEEIPPDAAPEAPPPVEGVPSTPVPEIPPPVEEVSPPGGDAVVEPSLSLDAALGSLTAFLDTKSQLQDNQELELAGIQTYALSPITSSSGLKGILLEIIGPYDNVVTQYKYQQSNNQYYTYVNEITPDYPWIASAGLFIALVISLFSLLKRSFSSWLK